MQFSVANLKKHYEDLLYTLKISTKTKVEIFVRHCHFSSISQHKIRHRGFTKQLAFENFMHSVGKDAHATFILDTFYPSSEEHFVKKQDTYPVIEIKEGTEGGSFIRTIDYVAQLDLHPETIIYFLEDDYVHRDGWIDILREGFSIPNIDYVTLYDHKDKYLPSYAELESKIFHTASCHWRTTPSTTNTFAVKFKTLLQHLDVHKEFSLNRKITADHAKFCKLGELGATLISSIPGWSTHMEPEFASPCTDWQKMLSTS
ncbi:MAG TPA: hypothetical protein VLG49_00920 [Rhabdochlamydiaceae bacterium]|nr:hypothetical protein [Rhabdochlamydiaceae bacterium]